ncbi:MAG: hypothetical protein GX685_05060, partial [Clostridiales bacterium]|nr:hypothetical protein [Clostridiales bacterium]
MGLFGKKKKEENDIPVNDTEEKDKAGSEISEDAEDDIPKKKPLRKMSRMELIDLIYALAVKNQELKAAAGEVKASAEDKESADAGDKDIDISLADSKKATHESGAVHDADAGHDGNAGDAGDGTKEHIADSSDDEEPGMADTANETEIPDDGKTSVYGQKAVGKTPADVVLRNAQAQAARIIQNAHAEAGNELKAAVESHNKADEKLKDAEEKLAAAEAKLGAAESDSITAEKMHLDELKKKQDDVESDTQKLREESE